MEPPFYINFLYLVRFDLSSFKYLLIKVIYIIGRRVIGCTYSYLVLIAS